MNGNANQLKGCTVLPPLTAAATPTPPKKATGKRSAGDRFAAVNLFCDAIIRDLPRAEALAWLLLWRDTKKDGLVRTSQGDLAKRSGTTLRTMERAIRKLIERQLLVVVRRGAKNCGASTYRVVAKIPRLVTDTHDGINPT